MASKSTNLSCCWNVTANTNKSSMEFGICSYPMCLDTYAIFSQHIQINHEGLLVRINVVFWFTSIELGSGMAAIISRVKHYLLLTIFYLALWAGINQNCDYKNNDISHSELEHRSRHLACVNLPRFVRTTKVRTRAPRFLPGRLQYTSKADSSFQIERHILSGDITRNPGPGKKSCKPKYPCKECGKQVK